MTRSFYNISFGDIYDSSEYKLTHLSRGYFFKKSVEWYTEYYFTYLFSFLFDPDFFFMNVFQIYEIQVFVRLGGEGLYAIKNSSSVSLFTNKHYGTEENVIKWIVDA